MAGAAQVPRIQSVDNNWHEEDDVIVTDQAVGLPEIGSFTLYNITPPMKEKEELEMWIDKAERILQTHNLHNLINKSIPRPMKNNPDGQKWKTLSKQVRSWPANSFGRDLLYEVYARGDRTGFADEFKEELKEHMEGERHGALKIAMTNFRKTTRSQFSKREQFLNVLKCRYQRLSDLKGGIPPLYAKHIMLSELTEALELETFVLAKDNELNAVRNPVEDITSTDFYRYSRAIWNYIIPMNAESPDLIYSTIPTRRD